VSHRTTPLCSSCAAGALDPSALTPLGPLPHPTPPAAQVRSVPSFPRLACPSSRPAAVVQSLSLHARARNQHLARANPPQEQQAHCYDPPPGSCASFSVPTSGTVTGTQTGVDLALDSATDPTGSTWQQQPQQTGWRHSSPSLQQLLHGPWPPNGGAGAEGGALVSGAGGSSGQQEASKQQEGKEPSPGAAAAAARAAGEVVSVLFPVVCICVLIRSRYWNSGTVAAMLASCVKLCNPPSRTCPQHLPDIASHLGFAYVSPSHAQAAAGVPRRLRRRMPAPAQLLAPGQSRMVTS
jgi:hypothetical protein